MLSMSLIYYLGSLMSIEIEPGIFPLDNRLPWSYYIDMERNAKQLQAKSRRHSVVPTEGRFLVTSGSSGETYEVRPFASGAVCNCKWAQYHLTGVCSHIVAVYDFSASVSGARVSVWANQEEAKRQHRPSQSIGDGLVITVRR